MLQQRVAVYYPKVTLTEDVTRFGSRKLLAPANPYVESLKNGKKLIRIDLLDCFKDIWGESILMNRNNIYKLVSGDCSDEEYKNILHTYYKQYTAFAMYWTFLDVFEGTHETVIPRFIADVRARINARCAEIDKFFDGRRGIKILLCDHEYIYYAVPQTLDLSKLKGVEIIA